VSKTKKLLASVLLVGVTASLAAFGVFSAFSSQTSNPGPLATERFVLCLSVTPHTASTDSPESAKGTWLARP